jgi:hypothetical protein
LIREMVVLTIPCTYYQLNANLYLFFDPEAPPEPTAANGVRRTTREPRREPPVNVATTSGARRRRTGFDARRGNREESHLSMW